MSNESHTSSSNGGPTIQVVAPCDMEAGFTFIARTASGDDMPVTVPQGGVREGQVFACRSNSPVGSVSNLTELTPLMVNGKIGQAATTTGNWKDEWWDCFRFGIFHASLWNACLCPQLLAAQVMTRLRLDWLGDPVESNGSSSSGSGSDPRTFNRVLLIVILYWIISTWTAPPAPQVDVLEIVETGTGEQVELKVDEVAPERQHWWMPLIYHAVTISFSLYTLLILTKLRHRVRRFDNIATHPFSSTCASSCCGCLSNCDNHRDHVALEDCCMSFWCGCCSVAQMARQTTDYAQEPAACCSSTGLLLRATPTASSTFSSVLSVPNGKFFPKQQHAHYSDTYVV